MIQFIHEYFLCVQTSTNSHIDYGFNLIVMFYYLTKSYQSKESVPGINLLELDLKSYETNEIITNTYQEWVSK